MLRSYSSFKKQAVAERHLFGSHEARWAGHCEGYTPKTLKKMLEYFGFEVIKTQYNAWSGTYNFEMFAAKTVNNISKNEFKNITKNYLKNYLLDDGVSETRLLEVWMEIFTSQLEKGWAQ